MIKAFKGFTRDLKCRDFQFKEGETFEVQGEPKLCEHGFHACEDPIDCFSYYAPGESEYHEVELDGVSPERRDDSKVVAKRIKIGARVSLKDMIAASIALRFSKTTVEHGVHTGTNRCSVSATGYKGAASATGDEGAASATGYKGAASATGDEGAASATGDKGAASATGYKGAASATGDKGAASATDYKGAASATGDKGVASATGYKGAASATGDEGAASATGDKGAASATGYKGAASATGDKGAASATGDEGAAIANGEYGAAAVTGKDSVAVSLGYKGVAKGALGDWIVIAEREKKWNEKESRYDYPIKEVKSFFVDGETIKADTFYELVDGKAVLVCWQLK